MEIRIYDAQFNLKKIIENHVSLLWHRCYNNTGDFTIVAPATPSNVNYTQIGNVVWVMGKDEAGVIESREIIQNERAHEITIRGRFLDSYMDRRLIRPRVNFSGLTEVAMRQLLSGAEPIPMVELGELNDFEETVEFQATYKNLLTYEQKLAKNASFGYRFRPDFVDKVIYFEIYKGLDHSIEQQDRARVTFSESYTNLTTASYSENDQLYKNVCYVGGQGEGEARTYVVVGDIESEGLARREMFIDATDISPEELTEAQYLDKLRQRGYEKLDEEIFSQAFQCTTNPNGNFIYKKHYDLGDIVTVQKEQWGIYQNQRITEITEIYEHGIPTIEPVFGTLVPESIDWEDN